jgi:hypothetical protein
MYFYQAIQPPNNSHHHQPATHSILLNHLDSPPILKTRHTTKNKSKPQTMASSSPATLRSLYRSLLRELPPRPILSSPRTPLHHRIRSSFVAVDSPSSSSAPASASTSASTSTSTSTSPPADQHQVALGHQLVAYLRAQRMYVTLIERYNPGMDMDQAERIRLTARRVGMDLPSLGKNGAQ